MGVTEGGDSHGWISSMDRMSMASVLLLFSGFATILNSKILSESRQRPLELTFDLEQWKKTLSA